MRNAPTAALRPTTACSLVIRHYREVTGYIIPTLYNFACATGDQEPLAVAQRATQWLLSLQLPTGAFPGGLHNDEAQPSYSIPARSCKVWFALTRKQTVRRFGNRPPPRAIG